MEHYIYAHEYGYQIRMVPNSLKMMSIHPTDHQLVSALVIHTVYIAHLYTNDPHHTRYLPQLAIVVNGSDFDRFYKTAGHRLSIYYEDRLMNGIQIAFYTVRRHYIFDQGVDFRPMVKAILEQLIELLFSLVYLLASNHQLLSSILILLNTKID